MLRLTVDKFCLRMLTALLDLGLHLKSYLVRPDFELTKPIAMRTQSFCLRKTEIELRYLS